MSNRYQKIARVFIISLLLLGDIIGQTSGPERININSYNKFDPISNVGTFDNNLSSNVADSNTTLIGQWTSGSCKVVEVENEIAYFGKSTFFPGDPYYLEIANVSDPSDPRELARIIIPSNLQDIAVSGDYVYVAVDNAGIRIINVSDSTNPYEVGQYDTEGSAKGIAVDGNYAYVADGGTGLRILNVSNPTNPFEVGYYDAASNVVSVVVIGDYAYVAGDKLRIINVSDPANPTQTGFINIGCSDVAVEDTLAYLASGYYLEVIDVSDLSNPIQIGSEYLYQQTYKIGVEGNFAYLTARNFGLRIVDISNPHNPIYKLHFGGGFNFDVDVHGNYAYVSHGHNGLLIFDMSDPINPENFGVFPTDIQTGSVAIIGDYAYVFGGFGISAGVFIFDISDPAKPIMVGVRSISGSKIRVSGNYAYMVGSGLRIMDVSDPINPFEIANLYPQGYATDIAISGDYVYIPFQHPESLFGLNITNISDPANPIETGHGFDNNPLFYIAVNGDYAYATQVSNGMYIFDISNPANPTTIGSFNTGGSATGVAVSGNYAYVADWGEGLRIIDVSNPASPSETGFFDTDGNASIVVLSGDNAYVIDGYTGLKIIDISDPANPTKTGFFDIDGYVAVDVSVSGSYAYVAFGEYGFCIIRNDLLVGIEEKSDPITQNFRLGQNYPNPFNPSTTIRYAVSNRQFVTLKIYDVLGNEVANLVNEEKPAGSYEINFNASNLSSGIYFYKLQTGSFVETKKMLLLK